MTAKPSRAAVASSLTERLRAGDAAALARAISYVESPGPAASAIHRQVYPHTGRAVVVGFTGPPGAGKSTLIDAYIAEVRRSGRTVAVAAIDPSSPITGGAVLGDRIRMGKHLGDPGVFIRSIASRGHLGGLSASIHRIIDVMDASGRDLIIIETVGTGQSEVEIAEVADVRIVVNAPGLGDDVQAIKAGVLEIADILVVNKADLPLADQAVRQLRSMLTLRPEGRQNVPVIETVATESRGIDRLEAAVAQSVERTAGLDHGERRLVRARRLMAQAAARLVREGVLALETPAFAAICREVASGIDDVDEGARRTLDLLARLGASHA